MKVSRTKIAAFLASHSLKDGVSKNLNRELAAYLLTERRTNELDSILRDVQQDWAEAGYVEVIAASAHPLTAQTKADIKALAQKVYPNAKRIIISEEPDPDVLGGVRLGFPGKQLDASARAKLNRFKQLTLNGKD